MKLAFTIAAMLSLAIATCFAQQSAEVKGDVQSRVDTPDRSVKAVDPDPEKTKDDSAARVQGAQPASSWSPRRGEAGKTPLDATKIANRPSSWTLKSKPVSAATAGDTQVQDSSLASHGAKREAPRAEDRKAGSSPPPARHTIAPIAAVPAPPATGFNPSSHLGFDPARRLSEGPGGMKRRAPRVSPRARIDSYCRTSTLSTETRLLCSQWHKKSHGK